MSDTPLVDLVEESPVESLPMAEEGDFHYDQRFLTRVLEGAILASGEALSLDKLLTLFDEDKRPSKRQLTETLLALQDGDHDRGFVLKEVASGWRFEVCDDLAPWVNRLWEERPQKYSRALLETIALVAYRQPLTRGDIEDVRGVAVSSHIIKTLLERDWVKIVGHRDVPGRPALYATTRQFLDYFGLKSLDELPSLGELQDFDSLSKKLELEDSFSEAQNDPLSGIDNNVDQDDDRDIDTEISAEDQPVPMSFKFEVHSDDANLDSEAQGHLDISPALNVNKDLDKHDLPQEPESETILSAVDSAEPPKNTEV